MPKSEELGNELVALFERLDVSEELAVSACCDVLSVIAATLDTDISSEGADGTIVTVTLPTKTTPH
jgi:hypothetical protein